MKCRAKSKRSQERCRRDAMIGTELCYMHSGTNVGSIATAFKHGRYSKHLPTRLLSEFSAALNDPTWASLRSEVALVDARLAELLSQLDTGESGALWKTLRRCWSDVTDSRGDGVRMAAALSALGVAIESGSSEAQRWVELRGVIDQRRTLVESERKRAVEMQQVITSEQAATLFAALTASLKRHVADRTILSAVSADLLRIFGEEHGG